MLLLETVGINVPRACPRGRKIAPGFPKPSALVIFSGCMAAAIRPPMGYGNLQDAPGLCPQAGKIGVRQTQKGLLVLLRHAGKRAFLHGGHRGGLFFHQPAALRRQADVHVSAPSGLKIQIAILFQPADGGIDGLLADVGQIADIPLQAAVAQKIKRIQNDGGAVGKPLPQCKIVVKTVQLFVKPVEFPYSGARPIACSPLPDFGLNAFIIVRFHT